jgi:hypothetical protein
VGAATVAVLLDGWPRALAMFDVAPMRVTASQARARLGLPMRENETETMYGAIAQGRRVFNGYSGYAAPQHAALLDLLESQDARILDRLAAEEPIEVVVESATDPDGRWRGWMDRLPNARRMDAGDGWTSYEIGRTRAAAPASPTGRTVAIAAITASTNQKDIGAVLDRDLDSRWHAPRQDGTETITLDLASAQRVSALVMCLGAYPGQYPRALAVDVSSDGSTWTTIRTGETALDTYDAAVRSPREVPVTIPVAREDVRFLRLRQIQTDRHGWSIVELRVLSGQGAGG